MGLGSGGRGTGRRLLIWVMPPPSPLAMCEGESTTAPPRVTRPCAPVTPPLEPAALMATTGHSSQSSSVQRLTGVSTVTGHCLRHQCLIIGSRACPPPCQTPSRQVGPRPDTFGGQRRLVGHREEPLLFEAELVRVRPPQPQPGQQAMGAPAAPGAGGAAGAGGPPGLPLYRLPEPPTYYGKQQQGRQ